MSDFPFLGPRDPNYVPCPQAARLLHRLIETGYAPDPPPRLPPDWAHAYQAVLRFVNFSRLEGWQVFAESAIPGTIPTLSFLKLLLFRSTY